MQVGTEAWLILIVEPNVAVNDDETGRTGKLRKHCVDARKLSAVELAGLVILDLVDSDDVLRRRRGVSPIVDDDARGGCSRWFRFGFGVADVDAGDGRVQLTIGVG